MSKPNYPHQTLKLFPPLLEALANEPTLGPRLESLAGYMCPTPTAHLRFPTAVAVEIYLWENWREASMSFAFSSRYESSQPGEPGDSNYLLAEGGQILEWLLPFINDWLWRIAGGINPCVSFDARLMVWQKVTGVLLTSHFIQPDNSTLLLPNRYATRWSLQLRQGENDALVPYLDTEPKLCEPADWYLTETRPGRAAPTAEEMASPPAVFG